MKRSLLTEITGYKKQLHCLALIIILLLATRPLNAQIYQWAKSFGGTGYDGGNAMAMDASGNIYTTGVFQNTVDFDPGSGTYNVNAVGFDNIFISKLYSNGTFAWVKTIGGSISTISYSIKVDAVGNIYTTGYIQGTVDFDPGPGIYNLTSNGGSDDIFVSKLDASGNFAWAKKFSGSNSEYGNAVTVDDNGNVYTTGYFYGTVDFDPGVGTNNLSTASGSSDAFISKLNAGGNYVWAKKLGGSSQTSAYGDAITVDAGGNVYTTGSFTDTVDFNPGGGVYNLISPSGGSAFISKLYSNGNFAWAKGMGGSGVYPNSIVIDSFGNIYTVGSLFGTADFDPGPGVYNMTATGFADAFISKLNSNGDFVWAKRIGSARASSVFVDTSGNVYTTGNFSGTTDFDPGAGMYNLTAIGNSDIFIYKSDANGNFVWAKNMGGSGSDAGGSGISMEAGGNICVAGGFLDTVDFNPPAQANLASHGYDDIFVEKYSQPGGCEAHFSIYADTIPHNWIALNQSSGVQPISYLWSWGDSTNSTGVTPSHIYNIPAYYNVCLNITDATGCVSTYCDSSTYIFRGNSNNAVITINVVLPTSIIEQNINNNGVIVYPNPSNNIITINSSLNFLATEIILYDASDREVMEKKFDKNVSFSVKQLNAGIYFYKIKNAKGNEVRGKLVKE